MYSLTMTWTDPVNVDAWNRDQGCVTEGRLQFVATVVNDRKSGFLSIVFCIDCVSLCEARCCVLNLIIGPCVVIFVLCSFYCIFKIHAVHCISLLAFRLQF